jgi:predicted RNase H-like HicB family nuclease
VKNTAGYIVLTFEFGEEGKRITAYCKELGTATFGRSLKEAKERLSEAVALHLNTLEQLGERERFFQENDIVYHKAKPRSVKIHIPIKEEFFIQPNIQRVPATIR